MEFIKLMCFLLVLNTLKVLGVDNDGNGRSKRQEFGTVGQEFVFNFLTPYAAALYSPVVMVSTASVNPVDVNVRVPGINFHMETTVTSSTHAEVQLPMSAYLLKGAFVQDKTVIVSATSVVSVYGMTSQGVKPDGFLAIPTHNLGTSYYVVTYGPSCGEYPTEFSVSAIEQDTHIHMTNTNIGYDRTITLDAYESYQVHNESNDLTGSVIHADKPIAVMAGSQLTGVPRYNGCNMLLEQLPPIRSYGYNFTLSPFLTRTNGYIYRVVASKKANVSITTGAHVYRLVQLLEGEMLEGDVLEDSITLIQSDEPIIVMLYMKGDSDKKGDTAMVVVPPMEMYSGNTTFPVYDVTVHADYRYYINIVAKCLHTPGLVYDDAISIADWEALSQDGMCVSRAPITAGSHRVWHPDSEAAFSITVYGIQPFFDDAFAYPAQFNLMTRCGDTSCNNGGTCFFESSNSDKNASCMCPDTHYGVTCQSVKTCFTHSEYACDHGACTPVHGTEAFTCACDSGYRGKRCSEFDPCASNPCGDGHRCRYLRGDRYGCVCMAPANFTRDICEFYNNCPENTHPCNAGKCKSHRDNDHGKFICDCHTKETGFHGEFCEFHDLCYRRPCLHNGTCSVLSHDQSDYTCHCPRGFIGKHCQTPVRCEADTTVDIRGFIQWPMLLIHRDIDVECQFGGTANRVCKADDDGRPRWEYPDTSNCQPIEMTRALAKQLILRLKYTTMNAFNMIEQELESATELLLAVATYTYDEVAFANDVMDCVSNLLYVNKSVMRSSSNNHRTNLQLLKLLDDYKKTAQIHGTTGSIFIDSPSLNIVLHNTSSHDIKNGVDYSTQNASIYLPRDVVLSSSDGNGGTRVAFITLLRDTFFIEDQLPLNVNYTTDCKMDPAKDRVVTSAEVVDKMVTNLDDPVILGVSVPKVNCPYACVFWNQSAQIWQVDGLTSHAQNDTFFTCGSDHLTYFSIILDPHYSQEPSAKHQEILTVISYVGCGITIVSLIVTIFSYILFTMLRRTISGKILINLCVALLGLNLTFISYAIPMVVDNMTICRGVAMAIHYFILVTFLWMGVEAIYMHQTLIKVFRSGGTKSFMTKAICVAWGLPVVPVAVVAGIDLNHYTFKNGVCMLSQESHYVYYISYMAPCITILAVNFTVFFLVLRGICACAKTAIKATPVIRRTQVGCAITIALLLGLSWVLFVLKIGEASLTFNYIFTIVNSLLGFFIFLFRCALNPEAKRSWRICCGECRIETQRSRNSGSGARNTSHGQKKVMNNAQKPNNEFANNNPIFDMRVEDGNNININRNRSVVYTIAK